jgi:uncharacterized protein (DUF433 family)
MRVEDFFDFQSDRDIRLKGARVGIENVLLDYLDEKMTAEQIAARYPSLTLEQVYATLLYYLHNKIRMDAYLEEHLADSRRRQEAQEQDPPAVVVRLRALRDETRQSNG